MSHEFGHSLSLLHVDGADAWFLGLFGRSQYYDSYKQERNRYNVMFSGANSKLLVSDKTFLELSVLVKIGLNL